MDLNYFVDGIDTDIVKVNIELDMEKYINFDLVPSSHLLLLTMLLWTPYHRCKAT